MKTHYGMDMNELALSFYLSHVDRYYQAADCSRARIPSEESQACKIKKTAADLRYGGGETTAGSETIGINALFANSFIGRIKPSPSLVWQNRTRTQRTLQTSSTGKWYPTARRTTCSPEHWHEDQ